MKIALIGHGNMGQEVERVLKESKKHTAVSINYKNKGDTLDIKGIQQADVAIDFTAAAVVVKNIETIAKLGIHIVVGTTGWYDRLDKVKKIVKKNKIGLIYGGNFSIGANIYFKIVDRASELFSTYGNYDVYGFEIHHTGKKDSPSGTAKKLGDIIMRRFPRKKVFQNNALQRQIEEKELHFTSVRGGRNPGHHTVIFDNQADEIRLTHQAHGRRGFAEGALTAAQFICDKKGLFEFSSIFEEVKQ